MPALPNASNIIRVDMHHSDAGDKSIGTRTFWRYSAAVPSNSDLSTLASHVASLWTTYLGGLAHPNVVLTQVVCTDLSSPTGGRGLVNVSNAGSRAGGPLPDNICTLLNFTLQRRYRGGKPRVYFPYGTQADIATDEQHWIAGYPPIVNSAWTSFSSNMNGNGFGGSVLHEQNNVSYYSGVNKDGKFITLPSGRVKNVPIVRDTALVEQIAGFSCNTVLGSQRRRLRPG